MSGEEIYARELFKCGKGYPLWQPEAAEDDVEVYLGDVGYLDKGQFFRMFNALKDQDDPLNNKPGKVPDGFEKLTLAMAVKKTASAVATGPLLSRSVKRISGSIDAASNGSRAGFEFECVDNQGACLVVGSHAPREEVHQDRRMKQYMKKNIDKWLLYATETLEMTRKLDEILFVRGWVKTTHWAIAAFVERGRNARLSVNGGFGSIADVGLGLSVESQSNSIDHHTGPTDVTMPASPVNHKRNKKGKNRTESQVEPKPQQDLKRNQCIFVHYFKMKRRLYVTTKMEAAAEPQDPSKGHDDDDDYADIEDVPARRRPYDPVDYVLDYILQHSEATEAIASDCDIIELCKNNEDSEYPIPDDIPAFLETTRPEIEVTHDGLGMLLFEDAITEQVIAESAALATQTKACDASNVDDASPPPEDITNGEATNGDPAPDDTLPEDVAGVVYDDVDNGPDEGDDKKVNVTWETSDSLLQMPMNINFARKGGIFALAYSPAGNRIAAGFEDSTVIVWDAESRRLLHELEGHNDSICSLAFSPTGQRLVTGSRDNLVIIWDAVRGEKLETLQGHEGFVNCVAYSPNGRLIASASVDSTVKLWEAESGLERATTDEHEAMVMYVTFSPDSTRVVSASADGVAHLWDTIDCARTARLEGHEGVIYTIAFSPDGRRLLTSSDDGSARVWSAVSGDQFMTLREHTGSVWSAVFSTDGLKILTVASDRTMKVCDSYGSNLLDTLEGGEDFANAAAFSPDGKLVAAGGEEHTVSVWSTETKQCIRRFHGHTDNINRIAFSPDGKRVISASDDGTVRLWKVNGPIPVVAVV